jgi:hypothetical protein
MTTEKEQDLLEGTTMEPPKNARKKSSGSKKKKTNVSGDMTPKELQTGWFYFFKIYAKLRRSSTTFADDEFKELAGAYINLANRYPMLKFMFLIMAPLATLGEFFDKFDKAEKGVTKKPKPPKPGTVDLHDLGGGNYGAETPSSSQTS